MEWLDMDLITRIAGEPFAQQLATWTCALGVASWLHSGRVRSEMSTITTAINNLATALRQDLNNHSNRIERVENLTNELKGRVLKLEKP